MTIVAVDGRPLYCPRYLGSGKQKRCSHVLGYILESGDLRVESDVRVSVTYDVVILTCPDCAYHYRYSPSRLPMTYAEAQEVIVALMDVAPLPAPLKQLNDSAQKIIAYSARRKQTQEMSV